MTNRSQHKLNVLYFQEKDAGLVQTTVQVLLFAKLSDIIPCPSQAQ